ncbi:hypothetical protein ROLI_004060 [Roseobacter fucihabitans]|uniref:Phytanoyl-CoA dioxygenase n=1 Tax=Roseobacter fucihabitans TaxID=1537242 RepID=A0ABZ2BMR9_9RHOB|nr:hypothetical protein [Roseobacter litoralis]MBC6963656.1 hypothetical protein [Roseobacter litoralis]
MAESLTAEQIARDREQGYLVPQNHIPDDWSAPIHAEIARFEKQTFDTIT